MDKTPKIEDRLRRLRETFNLAIAKAIEPPQGRCVKYLVFRVAGESFAWPAARLTEIVLHYRIVPLPGREESLIGVVNYKNHVLSVTNLHHLLNLGPAQPDKDTILLITKGLPVDTALLVDNLATIASVAPDAMKPKPIAIEPRIKNTIAGDFFHEGQMVTVLNPDAFDG